MPAHSWPLLQAVLPHRSTGEIRDYLKANQVSIRREVPRQAWTLCVNGVCVNGEPRGVEAKPVAKPVGNVRPSEQGMRIPSKMGERLGSGLNPSSRMDGQLLARQSMAKSTSGVKPAQAAPRSGGERAPRTSAMPTPDDSLFRDSSKVNPARLHHGIPKPNDGPKATRPLTFLGRNAAQPVSSKNLSPASTELHSSNVRATLREPLASTSLPPGFAWSGTSAPQSVAAEAPEVQSPRKRGASCAAEPRGISHKDSLRSLPSTRTVDNLDMLRRRALESSQRNGGQSHLGKGQKRPRSPAAHSRSSSLERHKPLHQQIPGRSRKGEPSRRLQHEEKGCRLSRSRSRSQSRSAEVPEQPVLARHLNGTQPPSRPLRSASSGPSQAEPPRAMSAREICKGLPGKHSDIADASISTHAAGCPDHASSEALPPGLGHQVATRAEPADSNKQLESLQAALEAELQLQLLHPGSQMEPGQAKSRPVTQSASAAGAAADMLPSRLSTANAASEKTAKIGGGLSFMDMGSVLQKMSSKDKDVKVSFGMHPHTSPCAFGRFTLHGSEVKKFRCGEWS